MSKVSNEALKSIGDVLLAYRIALRHAFEFMTAALLGHEETSHLTLNPRRHHNRIRLRQGLGSRRDVRHVPEYLAGRVDHYGSHVDGGARSKRWLTGALVLAVQFSERTLTASINADTPNPTLLAYATTKGAIQNFTAGLAQLLADKVIRANAVAPGPITPLIPSTMPEDALAKFGESVPMKRPGQPAELATAYVMLADPLSSYVSGATIAVTGGKPIL